MKILVISDSHGNITNLRHLIGFGKHLGVEAVIHAGDWDNVSSVQAVLSFGIPLYSVLGNADISPDVGVLLSKKCKKFSEDFLIVKIDNRYIGVTHKPSDIKKYFENKRANIIFYGHRHSKEMSIIGGTRAVRPGAAVLGINLAVYDTKKDIVEFVNYEQV